MRTRSVYNQCIAVLSGRAVTVCVPGPTDGSMLLALTARLGSGKHHLHSFLHTAAWCQQPTCFSQAVETGVLKTKFCTICKVSQPLTAYYKRIESKDGLQTACRGCQKCWAAQLSRGRRTPHYTGASQCMTCKDLKPAKEFYPRTVSVHGLQYECKACASVRLRSLYLLRKGFHRPSVQHKICRCCQAEQPSDQFYTNVAISDGLQSYCMPCMKAKYVQRRLRRQHNI